MEIRIREIVAAILNPNVPLTEAFALFEDAVLAA